MSEYVCLLVTILYESQGTLLRVALRAHRDSFPEDFDDYPMEPENRKAVHAMLPAHVGSCGPVVAIEDLFDIHVLVQ